MRSLGLELSLAGATFEDIARQLNMRHWMTAYRLYRRGLRRIPQKAAHEARVAQLERLNRLRLKVWSKFKDVSDTTELGVLVLAALRIETRESHLLALMRRRNSTLSKSLTLTSKRYVSVSKTRSRSCRYPHALNCSLCYAKRKASTTMTPST